jgi:hypothetical protein
MHQLLQQRSDAFEYTQQALLLLLEALVTCSHATFTFNTQQERDAAGSSTLLSSKGNMRLTSNRCL